MLLRRLQACSGRFFEEVSFQLGLVAFICMWQMFVEFVLYSFVIYQAVFLPGGSKTDKLHALSEQKIKM